MTRDLVRRALWATRRAYWRRDATPCLRMSVAMGGLEAALASLRCATETREAAQRSRDEDEYRAADEHVCRATPGAWRATSDVAVMLGLDGVEVPEELAELMALLSGVMVEQGRRRGVEA